jgi:Asp-tRNA(Asn)/Glu-tRNA(Gln) amidotransferase C subunit
MTNVIQGEFHVHIDAQQMASEFEAFVIDSLGFYNTDFSGHPEGALHFETPKHLTYKTKDAKAFKETFDRIEDHLKQNPNLLTGYVEGEYIPLDIEIAETPFNQDVPVPCKWDLQRLPAGVFREDEVHVTLDRDRSHPELIQSLRKMGFFSAYMNKSYGTAEILTVQGSRTKIQQLLSMILPYLKNAGGAVHCSVKEERVIRWWASSPSIQFPPIANVVTMF